MTAVQVVGIVLAGFFVIVGVAAAATSLRETTPEDSGRVRFLLAVHDAAKAGFWLALGAVLLGLSVVERPGALRWLGLVPVSFAALRLGAAYFLSRS